MKPEEKDIRGFLADTYSDYEPTPKRDVWEDIAAKIEEKPRKGWAWGYRLAVACAALLVAVYLLRLEREPGKEKWVQHSETVQPKVDSATHYTEKTLVPREESEAESPKEVLPSTPSSPSPQLVKSPPKPEIKEELEKTPQPLFAELETPIDSITQPLDGEVLDQEVEVEVEIIAISEPEGLPQTNLAEETAPLSPVSMPSVETPTVVVQEENKNGFSLKELTFEKALMAASQEIDKRFDDAPISAREVEENGETIRTLRFKIGGFSITHKRKVKSSKAKRT